MAKKRENTGLVNGLKLRNGIFHYRFMWNGDLQTGSCKTGNEREARKYLEYIRSQMKMLDIDVRINRQATFKDAYDLYIQVMEPRLCPRAVRDIKSNCRLHWQFFLYTPIRNIQPAIDELYVSLANIKKLAPGTQGNHFNRIRAIIELARKRGMHNTTPEFPDIKIPRDPKRTLSDEEIEIFFDHLDREGTLDHKIMIRSMYFLGMRVSEARRLAFDDLSEDNLTYRIDERQKNGKIIYQPVPEEMARWFSMKERKPGELMCPSRSGGEHPYRFTEYVMCKISELMGLKQPITHHRLRASFITNIQKNGCPLATATKLARHSSPETTLKYYTELDMQDMRKGLEALKIPQSKVVEFQPS